MTSMDIAKAKKTACQITVFVKNGGQESLGVPASFLPLLIESIQKKGYETLHLANGRTIQVTGFLVGGKLFHEETRIIIIGEVDEK